MVYTTDKYIHYHDQWFQDDSWKLTGSITDSHVGSDVGTAIVQMKYEVPKNNGKDYWNEMAISYVMKKVDNQWYVISDHSSSVKKSS